jgi:hypothetical protein
MSCLAADAVGAADLVVLWPAAVSRSCLAADAAVVVADRVAAQLAADFVLQNCPAADAAGVADPVALRLAVSRSCLAADAPVAVADLVALCLAAVVAVYWLAAALVLKAWPALAASPGSSAYPVDPGVIRPEQSIREAKAQPM